MLQSSVLPGTSTPRAMQGDGTISGMTETSQRRSRLCSPRGLAARWRGMRTLAAIALVCAALGGCITGEVFYYISQRSERKVAFMNQQVVDQRVIAIYFDKNRQVQRLANYGLQDGRIFDFISRTTPTSGQELSYLTPLFKLLSFN